MGRALATWVATAIGLAILAAVLPGLTIDGWRGALVFAAALALANTMLWPTLIGLALPLTVLTLGLGALVLNGLVVWLLALGVPGVEIDGVWTGIVVTIGLAVLTAVVGWALAVNDDDAFTRQVARRHAGSRTASTTGPTGVLFVEIDGLAADILRRAMRDGNAPTLSRWVRKGSHRLLPWETDWSSQTGACQAGLLHGCNEDLPAFRWYEKDRGKPIVSNRPADAAEIERRCTNGHGLLHDDGASRGNLLSGDAPSTLLTMSTVRRPRRGPLGRDYYGYFANPSSLARTIVLGVREVIGERRSAARAQRWGVEPAIHRHRTYALLRAYTNVVQRDIQASAVISDLYAGRPVIYATLLGYDEVAHHSGIERRETLEALREIDDLCRRLALAAADAPRDYEVVVLSDHGQSQGAPFRQRYGETLTDVVSAACRGPVEEAATAEDEGWGQLGGALTEAAQAPGAAGATVRVATRRRRVDGEVEVGPDHEDDGDGDGTSPEAEVIVMASGNLGLIAFPDLPGRATREQIEERHPGLLDTLRRHPGIGFLLVATADEGPVCLGATGERYLASDRVVGDDPLEPFGPNAARHVLRTHGFAHCPDIVVNSAWWPDTEEVAAFEELVGCHGGLGGPQSHPFLLVPAGWSEPAEELVGAEAVHRQLRRWLAALGHEAHAGEPPAPLRTREDAAA